MYIPEKFTFPYKSGIGGAFPYLNKCLLRAWMQYISRGIFFLSYISVVSGRKVCKRQILYYLILVPTIYSFVLHQNYFVHTNGKRSASKHFKK